MAETLVMTIPNMYADHHVQRVRDVIFGLKGITEVWASSMDLRVGLTYEPAEVQPEAIRSALAEAGYEESLVQSTEARPLAGPSAWRRGDTRATRSSEADMRMAGDFRKY